MNISIDVSSTEAVNIFNTPSNVTLIDRETILRYEYQAVAEAIRSVAGIEVLQSNIDRNIITSRGVLQNYYTNKVLIMINGISTWQPIYGSGIIDRIDINDVERIEILKGPASVLYGTNAYTGVVNIVLKEASTNEVNAKLQVGNYHLGAGSVNLTHVKNDLKLFIAANSSYEKRKPDELLSTRGQLFNGDSVYFYEEQYIGYNLSSEAQYKNHYLFVNKFTYEHTSPGFFFFDISVVVASASIFKTNSRFVILSRRFSFFKFLKSLYSLVLKPDQALVISSVKMAYSSPSFTPRSFHSSVNSFRTSMVLSR